MNGEDNPDIMTLRVARLKTSDAYEMALSMLGDDCPEWHEGARQTLSGFARNLERALTQLEKAHAELSKALETLQKEQRA